MALQLFRKILKFGILILPLSLLISCSHRVVFIQPADKPGQPPSQSATADSPQQPLRNPILDGIADHDIEQLRSVAEQHYHNSWNTIADRSRFVRQRILHVIDQLHAPSALQLLPIIESTYDPYAISPSGAVGLWQLMPKTARGLGIQSDQGQEGRRNIEQASRAAISYLMAMEQRFNNWPLAIAAYNMGPNAVARRLKQQPWHTQDGLDNMPIPEGTRRYVQHFIGLVALFEDQSLSLPEPIPTQPLSITAPIDLQRLARLANLDENDLFRFNPELNHGQYLHGKITIHVPTAQYEQLAQNIAHAAPQFIQIAVRPGDNLWNIAKRHHTDVATLKSLNPQRGKYLHIGQQLKVPAGEWAQAHGSINPLLASKRRIRYKVRSGDSLWRIAHRFGTTPKAIARANNIKMNHPIRAGDTLWVFKKVRPS